VTSPAGKKIMSVCEMGFACEVKVIGSSEESDVFEIDRVISVVNIG
jgi:hypothetical protein